MKEENLNFKGTLYAKFIETAKKFPDKPALLYKKSGVYIAFSFTEVKNKINLFSRGLFFLGVKKGDRVAILSKNRTEWPISDLAVLKLGAITVPIHTTLSHKITAYILNHSEASTLIVSGEEQLHKILIEKENLPYLKNIIYLGLHRHPEANCFNFFPWKKILEGGKKTKISENIEVEKNDIASIIYTSGTTGLPKGVMLSHKNFLENIKAARKAVFVGPSDILLSFLPLSHALERTAGYYTPLLSGAAIAYTEDFQHLAKNLKEVKPTILISVPRVFEKFHDALWEKVKNKGKISRLIFEWGIKQEKGTFFHKIADYLVYRKIRKALGGRIRYAISGGASLDKHFLRFFNRVGIQILEGYGLTETAPIVSVNRLNKSVWGSVGKPLPKVQVKIAADKEILVKGPNIMLGYYKDEKATTQAINNKKWFHTGDLGFIDNEGYLYVIGRKTEMIVLANGKNVWPNVLENALITDRFISQVIVLGHRKKYLTALIVPDWQEVKIYVEEKGDKMTEFSKMVKKRGIIKLFEERIEKNSEHFAEWEKIRKFILLSTEFTEKREELTPTLKLRRETICGHYKREIGKMYK